MNTKNIAINVTKVLACLTLGLQVLLSQASSTRQVLTLQVVELNKIGLVGSNFTLVVNSVDPRTLDYVPAINTSTTLVWTSNGENKKITVASNNHSPRFVLNLVAEKLVGNAKATTSEVTFSDASTRDLVVGLSRSSGKCVIRFAADSEAERGVGQESHIITFTITSS